MTVGESRGGGEVFGDRDGRVCEPVWTPLPCTSPKGSVTPSALTKETASLPIGVPSKLFGTKGLRAYYVPGTLLGSGEIQW